MEPNPIYWIELHQARRSGFLYVLLGAGLIVGGFVLHIVFLDGNYSHGSPIDVMPFWFFLLGMFGITFYPAVRFVMQLLDEDLVLSTPLSASKILRGKFQLVPVFTLGYFGPSLPGVILLAWQGTHDPVFLWTVAAIVTIFLGVVVPGFLAGARTVPKTLGLVFVLVVFLHGAAGVYFILFLPLLFVTDLYGWTSGSDGRWVMFAAPCFGIVAVQACFLAYQLGISLLERDRNAFKLKMFCPIMVLLFSVFWAPVCACLILPVPGLTIPTLVVAAVSSCMFYFSPLFALQLGLSTRPPMHGTDNE